MAKNESLLAALEASLQDDRSSITSLLQKCILLGGQVGSSHLRDWARQELKGYGSQDTIPEYRRVRAIICADGTTFGSYIRNQQIAPHLAAEVRPRLHD